MVSRLVEGKMICEKMCFFFFPRRPHNFFYLAQQNKTKTAPPRPRSRRKKSIIRLSFYSTKRRHRSSYGLYGGWGFRSPLRREKSKRQQKVFFFSVSSSRAIRRALFSFFVLSLSLFLLFSFSFFLSFSLSSSLSTPSSDSKKNNHGEQKHLHASSGGEKTRKKGKRTAFLFRFFSFFFLARAPFFVETRKIN